MKISVVGLGKLGSCTATCFALKGYNVIGIDINENIIKLINKKKAPYIEPLLEDSLKKVGDKLIATNNYEKAIHDSNITFIILPTPSKKNGEFSDKYLKASLKKLGKILKDKKEYHTFVVVSTVSPGTIQNSLIPIIEKFSNKKLNIDFGMVYNPEFIALGNVIKDFLNPDLVLIGESDKKCGKIVEDIYKKVCENTPYIARMSIISAEITKIAINSFVTMKISFANTLGNICEYIPEANIDNITRALGADKRISPYYLKAGLSYGGPCFPRDNKAFMRFAQKYGINAELAKATDKINNFQINFLFKKIKKYIISKNIKSISVLGTAYKINTPVIDESPAIKLIEKLLKLNIKINVYDPLAINNTKKIFNNLIYYFNNLKKCIEESELIIIALPYKEFRTFFSNYKNKIIIDCWRILNNNEGD